MKNFTWLNRLYDNVFTAFVVAIIVNFFNFVLSGGLTVAGIFVVPVALKRVGLVEQKTLSKGSKRKIQTFAKGTWCWVFGNDYDGINGDSGGDWKKGCDSIVLCGLLPLLRKRFPSIPVVKWKDALANYWWLAFRNPANNLRLVKGFYCEVKDCVLKYYGAVRIEDKYRGFTGWQLVIAVNQKTNVPYFGFYSLFWWDELPLIKKIPFFKDRHCRIRLGYKIKPEHEGADDTPKGLAFSILPFRKYIAK